MPRTCPDCGWVWPKPQGACPNCGSDAAPEARPGEAIGVGDGHTPQNAKMPWHLWLFVIALAVYLGWRLVQGIIWVAGRF